MVDSTPTKDRTRAKPGCFTGCFIILLVAWLLLVASTISAQEVPWALYRAGGYETGHAVVAVVGALLLYGLKLIAEAFWNWLMKDDTEGER